LIGQSQLTTKEKDSLSRLKVKKHFLQKGEVFYTCSLISPSQLTAKEKDLLPRLKVKKHFLQKGEIKLLDSLLGITSKNLPKFNTSFLVNGRPIDFFIGDLHFKLIKKK